MYMVKQLEDNQSLCANSSVVRIPRCQRGGPGSIPGWRIIIINYYYYDYDYYYYDYYYFSFYCYFYFLFFNFIKYDEKTKIMKK